MVDAIAYTIKNLVMSEAMSLEERLASILSNDGGKTTLGNRVNVDDVHAFNGMSGYNYWIGDDLVGQLYIGSLLSGTYVIYKKTYIDDELVEVYDYYDTKGNFFYKSKTLDGQCVMYTSTMMDPTSPFINHIYNILNFEYSGATQNFGNTGRIQFLEQIVNKFYKDENFNISVDKKLKDLAIININKEILEIENDKILKWSERQNIYSSLKQVRARILSTKRRAHKFQYLAYDLPVQSTNIKLKVDRIKKRPLNNFLGSLYRWTIGSMIYFCNTVKNNLGISIAMAIYGPFTFYFITQPMNPHAMWAVGKVRNAYIEIASTLESDESDEQVQEEVVASNGETQDSVSTQQASIKDITTRGRKKVSWGKRMDNFKAMQIAYEENMVFAERMGRIEQFETQFNFPLTAEAAWMEMELYLNKIQSDLDFFKNLDARYVSFLNNEKERTIELQFYIWQKMGQFFIDHPFIVVDEEDEQTQRNYYLGRQFVFFKKMTDKLNKIGIANSPITHKNIATLAEKFKKMKVPGSSVLDTLKKNSKLFKQKDFLSTVEHRKYMTRQWEVLFMQQNKKQEASSFALQAYTWSVRNAIWLLQTIYSSKRSELPTMTYKYNLDNTGTQGTKANTATNEYLENMFHNLAMEFVSIKKEIAENLPNDNEANLRTNVINNVKQYIIERDKLFNTGVFASKDSESNNI